MAKVGHTFCTKALSDPLGALDYLFRSGKRFSYFVRSRIDSRVILYCSASNAAGRER